MRAPAAAGARAPLAGQAEGPQARRDGAGPGAAGYAEREALRALAACGPARVLVVYEHLPDPGGSGADLRIVQIVELLRRAGHEVVFLGRSPRPDGREDEARAALSVLGVRSLGPDPERVFWQPLDAPRVDLDTLLAEGRFDAAILYAYFWVGVSVAEQYLAPIRRASPSTRVLLLSDDCHWLREERRAAQADDRTALERARGLREKELDSYRRADLLLTITEEDAARMRAQDASLDPLVVAFAQDAIRDEVPDHAERTGLVFLGSGANDANVRSIAWFVAEVLPLVRARLSGIALTVVGEPPAGGWSFAGAPGIETPGRVPELAPWLDRARVFVSPVVYGTGLKTKNVQALGAGLPIVATPVSAEGMRFEGDLPARVRADPGAFAEAVVALHEDAGSWRRASRAALAHARRWFGRERTALDLAHVLSLARERSPRALDPRPSPFERVDRVLSGAPARPGAAARYAAHLELARALRAAGAVDDALLELRSALCELCCLPADASLFAQPHALLAQAYLAGERWLEAARAAEEALRIDPRLPETARAVLARIAQLARTRCETPARDGPG